MSRLFNLGDLIDRSADSSKLALIDLSRLGKPKKYTHKDVVEFISKKENLPKKMIYEFCLKLKKKI